MHVLVLILPFCHHCRVKASTYKTFLMENPDSLLRMIQVRACTMVYTDSQLLLLFAICVSCQLSASEAAAVLYYKC